MKWTWILMKWLIKRYGFDNGTKTNGRADGECSKEKEVIDKKEKSWFQKHVSRTSSSLSTNQSQLIKVLVLIGIAGLCVLSVINFGLRAISNQKLQTQEALRQEQLSKKEQETNKLANQRQKAKEAAALVVEK